MVEGSYLYTCDGKLHGTHRYIKSQSVGSSMAFSFNIIHLHCNKTTIDRKKHFDGVELTFRPISERLDNYLVPTKPSFSDQACSAAADTTSHCK